MFRCIFLLLSLLLIPHAKACSCPATLSTDQQVVDGMMQNAVMVFVGKVTAANLPRLNSAERSFQLEVHERFKGLKKNLVTVFSALRSADCGTTLAVGKTYLVAAYGRENVPIIHSCDRPEEIEFVAQRITACKIGWSLIGAAIRYQLYYFYFREIVQFHSWQILSYARCR